MCTNPYSQCRLPQTSPTQPDVRFVQKAVYPQDSLIGEFHEHAIRQVEGADAWITGSLLPVVASLLGRRVYFQDIGDPKIYPNLFSMIAGPPGFRKSSTIKLVKRIAKILLPPDSFIPEEFSREALFDMFWARPDLVWIVEEANIVLTDWLHQVGGQRVGTKFLTLYDCGEMEQEFRANAKKQLLPSPTGQKFGDKLVVSETSTSLVFGATYASARFEGQVTRVQDGMVRRFLYYLAEDFGREIYMAKPIDIGSLAMKFNTLLAYKGQVTLEPAAEIVWKEFQQENRELARAQSRFAELELSRLATAPTHVIKVATCFEAARQAFEKPLLAGLITQPGFSESVRPIQKDTLELAIAHVEESFRGSRFLEIVATLEHDEQEADRLLAHIQIDFDKEAQGDGWIYLDKSTLTHCYAPHPNRNGATRPDDLYLKYIPVLTKRGDARFVEKQGKRVIYAFKARE